MTSSITLPDGLRTRPARRDDAKSITAVCVEHELATIGTSESIPTDITEMWDDESMNLDSDTLVVTTEEGKLIGYTGVAWTRRGIMLDANMSVRLAYQDQPIASYLLQFALERARVLIEDNPRAPRLFFGWSFAPDTTSLLERHGFKVVSSDYRMYILFDEPPAAPAPLEGITIRPFIQGQEERAVYTVIAEAFPDIDGKPYRPYEDWYEKVFEKTSSAEPSMFYVAVADGEVVGTTLCRIYPEARDGFIWQVGVRRPWRKRGIALALLQTAFHEYYQRGVRKVQLDVDSMNQTGAHELYRRAGMRVRSQVDYMTMDL